MPMPPAFLTTPPKETLPLATITRDKIRTQRGDNYSNLVAELISLPNMTDF